MSNLHLISREKIYTVEPRFWQHFGKHPFVAKIGVFSLKTPNLTTKDFELLQYQTVSKHAKVTKIFKILFLASKTIGISLVPLCFHVYGMISAKQWQIINKILIFHQIFCEMGEKMLLNSGFSPKNVAKFGVFYVVKKPKKWKSC